MQNLELKHLAPYLPFEPKVIFKNKVHEVTFAGKEFVQFNYGKGKYQYHTIKPLLIPLSQLYCFIPKPDKSLFIPIVELANIHCKTDWIMSEDDDKNPEIIGRINIGIQHVFFLQDFIPLVKEIENNIFSQEHNGITEHAENLTAKTIIEKLYEWHFDINGLIDAGLALNKLDYIK